ncbi:MAG TPA: hypothetical protein VKU37_12280 [Verrucomicrobiae bacterium]|nr:hypothetical protein [Verrucomicrobiae bacterium]
MPSKIKWLAAVSGFLVLALAGMANATPVYTLSSGNSSVTIDAGSQAGMDNWTVDGQNQLNQQWFWYRIGSTGPAASINTISAPTANQLSPSILNTTYANAQFSVTVLYSLIGGASGSGTSDLSEQISIQNLTGSRLTFDFFQYADFNLGGTPNNDTGQLDKNGNKYGGVTQYNSPGCRVSENVDAAVSQPASYGQIGTGSGATSSILNLFGNSGFGHLNDQNNTPYGGGNVNWGLEWDANIAPGGTLIISKDLNIVGVVPVTTPVPEPGAWSFVLLGLFSYGLYKYRLGRRIG